MRQSSEPTEVDSQPSRVGLEQHGATLQLLGTFRLNWHGRNLPIGPTAQRLVAYLATHAKPATRTSVARALWPDVPDSRGFASLRSALWRLRQLPSPLVQATDAHVSLDSGVSVDVLRATEVADLLLDQSTPLPERELSRALRTNFHDDLLPGFDGDDWLIGARERFRQLRLHCLELLCAALSSAGWHGAAIDCGIAAVYAEPLRESAHVALVRAYAAEGNHHEVLRWSAEVDRLLQRELGVQPGSELRDTVQGCLCQHGDREPSPWAKNGRVQAAGGHRRSATEAVPAHFEPILDALLRGNTDATASRLLGTSPRTFSRRVAELLTYLAVETRFQGGVEVVRRGWVAA